MTLSAAERERRALIRANRPAPRTDAERQAVCRARKRAKRDALVAEAARIAEHLLLQDLASIAERDRIEAEIAQRAREAEEQAATAAAEAARRAEEARVQAGIADGTLHPDGRLWRLNEARSIDRSSPRAMMEAGRRAAVQYSIAQFDKTGALAPDPDGPRRRPERPAGRVRYDWHRDY